MLFSSTEFLFYFLPIVLVLYYIFRFSFPIKNFILLIASLFFYAWGEPSFVLIMLISIVFNYLFALIVDIAKQRQEKGLRTCHMTSNSFRKLILWLSVILNTGLLFVFKYLDFFIRNWNEATNMEVPYFNLALPIGISFFTFQAMSYVVDVYRGNAQVQKNLFNVALYISFFPQLVAGPIVKYQVIEKQMTTRKETINKFSVGACRFITGLAKKILLSNQFAIVTDQIYKMNEVSSLPTSLAWVGAISYTLQIFFDFSGYSDMAIGLGLMFGFEFEENFNYPYISRSVSEFWRRWHISLGTWFKEYVYFPLGGSRVSNQDIMIRNMFVVWLCTGFWHGAEWTFVIWGLMNFVALLFERFVHFEQRKGNLVLRWIYTFLFINFSWVIFRSENLILAGRYLKSMFGIGSTSFSSDYAIMFLKEYWIFFIIGGIFCTPIARRVNKYAMENKKLSVVCDMFYTVLVLGLYFVCIAYLIKGTYNPFIYFNF